MYTVKSIILVLLVCVGIEVTKCENWATKLNQVLQARDSYIEALRNLKSEATSEKAEAFIAVLKALTAKLKGIENFNVAEKVRDRELLIKVINEPEKPIISEFFQSANLEKNYAERGLGYMLNVLRTHYNLQCIRIILSPPGRDEGTIPMKNICSKVKKDLAKSTKAYTFSTAKICENVNTCLGATIPHPYGDSDGTSVQDACAEADKCDVAKAVPMMAALLWYKISDFIAHGFCSNVLGDSTTSSLQTELKEIKHMTNLIMAYSCTLNWKGFFKSAVQMRAYSNLGNAMALFNTRVRSMEYVSSACSELQANDACAIEKIKAYYESLKKLERERKSPRPIRNLRLYSNIDHSKMIAINEDSRKQIELLGSIESLNKDLRTSVAGISNYFQGVAKYDQRIAEQDVAFLAGKLTEYDQGAASLTTKVERDLKNVLTALGTAQVAQFAEESVLLGLRISENLNLADAIFGGVKPGDIYEQTVEVARAFQELTRSIALIANLNNTYNDTLTLQNKFVDNAAQFTSLSAMVDGIKENKISKISSDADKFITAYGGYTPKVNKADLAKNDALWAAFKESACDLLLGAEGVGASVVQATTGGMLLCEKLEGSLAEFAVLRENIFDFQFDLVDSLARVVRGNVATKLADSITVTSDELDASQLMLGFFMNQYKLQSHALMYCDRLEYLNQGKGITACSSGGFLTSYQLQVLMAYRSDTAEYVQERIIYIPTHPRFNGDTGFISLQALAKGDRVTFRPPANVNWLRKYNWLAGGETTSPYVQDFKLYLPLKKYNTGSRAVKETRTRIVLKSVSGSSFHGNPEVVYLLPDGNAKYITTYKEFYSYCPTGKEMKNPYSLCDNLPNICDASTRNEPEVMPTLISTWNVSYSVESGENDLDWDAPDPATNLLIRGKVELKFLPGQNKRGQVLWKRPEKKAVTPDNQKRGCCLEGNQYRPDPHNERCENCPSKPTRSLSQHGGLYCKKGNEPVASKPLQN